MPSEPTLSRRQLIRSAALTAAGTAVAAGVGPSSVAVAAPTAGRAPFSPDLPLVSDQAWHVARRAAHAPTAALAARIRQLGTAAWVKEQLTPGTVPDTACEALLDRHLPWLRLTTAQLRAATGEQAWKGAPLVVRGALVRQVFSQRVLAESVIEAMSDQVYVAAAGKAEWWILDFDRTVVRRHALGKFSALLGAALTHPALLAYLDNDGNTKRNPNENLGRELLELHTVGVGSYTEADVRQSALLLTGHTFDWDSSRYVYRASDHYTGALKIMGFKHPNKKASDGPAVLAAYVKYLATRKTTATRVCRRLAVRFVSDAPSDALVADLVTVYLAAGTDITAVVKALFAHREFTGSVGKKWRRPQEWAAAALRAGNPTWAPTGTQDDPWSLFGYHAWMLEGAQHQPRMWPAVNGYPDQAGYWMSTNGMLAAWNHAEAVVGHADDELAVGAWTDVLGLAVGQDVWAAAAQATTTLTGYTWRRQDLAVVASLMAGDGGSVPSDTYRLTADNIRWSCTEAVRMIFSSPYFLIR